MPRLILTLTLALAACVAAPPPTIAPPIVMTVIVTTAPESSPLPPAAGQPPAPRQNTVAGVYQDFETGLMIYLADRRAIWVWIRPDPDQKFGEWLAFADTFQEGDPETDPSLAPPADRQQPKRGFGKVWRENSSVRAALGWALDYERPITLQVTDYPIGPLDAADQPNSFIYIVNIPDTLTVHVDEATQIWSQR